MIALFFCPVNWSSLGLLLRPVGAIEAGNMQSFDNHPSAQPLKATNTVTMPPANMTSALRPEPEEKAHHCREKQKFEPSCGLYTQMKQELQVPAHSCTCLSSSDQI